MIVLKPIATYLVYKYIINNNAYMEDVTIPELANPLVIKKLP